MCLRELSGWKIRGAKIFFREGEKMKTIMVVAGGTWQVPLIKRIKEMGYRVVNTNLYSDSPGFQYADQVGVMDVLDKESNLKFARENQVDAVLTEQSDIAVPTVAYVAEKMGCHSIGRDMAELFTNKYKMREFCQKNNFSFPEYCLCENVEQAVKFFQNLGTDVIIKPLDSQSSRGVFTIRTEEEMRSMYPIAERYTNKGNYVLAERYIRGTEFTVDGLILSGRHHTLAISEKSHFEYNPNIASKLFFTYQNEKFDYDCLRDINNAIIDKSGLKNALTHAEYKFEEGKFYLIEMAARGGGTRIASDVVPYVSGVDNYKYLIEASIGVQKQIQEEELNVQEEYKERCAVLSFLDIESNGKRIEKIEGIEKIRAIPEVVAFETEFSEGDIIEQAQDDRSRVGFYIICAESRERLEEITEMIKRTFKITFK